jgi:hypothetical protein
LPRVKKSVIWGFYCCFLFIFAYKIWIARPNKGLEIWSAISHFEKCQIQRYASLAISPKRYFSGGYELIIVSLDPGNSFYRGTDGQTKSEN